MKCYVRAIAVIGSLVLSSAAFAKSETFKLEISGPGLTRPLDITEPEILNRFSIWGSPGIDWSRGNVAGPLQVEGYTVTFHQRGREPMHDWHRRYVISYRIDAATGEGYIYLPGPDDGDVYERNTFSILREVEGNWFHASEEWEEFVRPLIERASNRANELAQFKMTVGFDAATSQVVLKCPSGCAWRELKWSCNGRDNCSSEIDASGMTGQ
jgi:hypothetical protein